ncbi:MAG: 30S ribosomal protein S20 [Limnochordia bacterium]
MPHIPIIVSSRKRARQAVKREARNKSVRSAVRTYVGSFEEAEGPQKEVAYRQAASALDRAAKSGVIHPNQAARKKSRLAKRLHQSA